MIRRYEKAMKNSKSLCGKILLAIMLLNMPMHVRANSTAKVAMLIDGILSRKRDERCSFDDK